MHQLFECERRRGVAAAIAALLYLGISTSARAQSTTSLIRGTVVDQNGGPIKGVRVTVRSDTQIGGPKSAYTDDDGSFRIAGLLPGVFDVTATAPGLKTVVQKGVEPSVNAPADVTLVMELETAGEEVTVVERPPTVSTTAANVKETFSAEFAEQVPLTTRSYQNMADQAVGWNATGNNFRVRGGNVYDNNYMIDGFQLQDPVTRESAQNISFGALSALEVQSAAYGAENATAQGGVLNVVTKSGSNKLGFDLQGTFTSRQMEFWRDNDDTTAPTRNGFINATLTGPILKDRLWFVASVEAQQQVTTLGAVNQTGLELEHPARSLLAFRTLGKLTWQVSSRNKLSLLTMYAPEQTENAAQRWEVFPEAERMDRSDSLFSGLTFESLITDSLVYRAQVGFNQMVRQSLPQSCLTDPDCYARPSIRTIDKNLVLGNHEAAEVSTARQWQFNSDVQYFADNLLGDHQIKVGFRSTFNSNPYRLRTPGDAVLTANDLNSLDQPVRRRDVCANDPGADGQPCEGGWMESSVSGETGLVFLQDAWRVRPRVTITPGASLTYGRQRDENGNTVIEVLAPTPHLSAVWDATGDGKTALRGSFAGYVDTGFLRLARYGGRQPYSNECRFDPATGGFTAGCTVSGGLGRRTIGKPCGDVPVNADGTPCDEEHRIPRTWEYTVGAEREIFSGVALGGDLIYRRYINQWEDAETNRIWNEGGTALDPDGGFRNGRAEAIYDVTARSENWRRYLGLTLFIRKYVGDFQALIAWTRHSQYGSPLTYQSDLLLNAAQTPYYYGFIETDQRNEAKFMGYYKFTSWLTLGTNVVYRNGFPYSRYYYNPVTNGYDDLRSPIGTDPRNPNDANDDLDARLPDVLLVYAQLRFKLKSLIKHDVETWIDAFNLAGNREPQRFTEEDGPTWGQVRSRRSQPPYFRVGLRYQY